MERYGRHGGMAVQAMVGPLMGNVRSAVMDEILQHIGGSGQRRGSACSKRVLHDAAII
ncbi:MAG: hypothetical protein HZB20_09145 [Chloroflexi bacterium]|nr:hypothetical protein [Verrucomicrobiota bacterium]MBI5829687.1 hypothetical protein [Chloroflexota bacterium]